MRKDVLTIVVIAIIITAIGISCIYSSTYQRENKSWKDVYTRQVLWVFIGFAFFIAMSNLNYRRIWDATYILYAISLVLLLAVCMLGITRLGAQRWLRIAWFNFQPSELAKIVVVIFLSRYFSRKSVDSMSLSIKRFSIFRGFVLPFMYVAVFMGFIVEQPDLGSALIMLMIFVAMAYLAGVRVRYVAVFLIIFVVASPIVWNLLREYQKDRLMVFLNPNIDPLGAGYTIIQSKIAIGSGGFFGKGWLSGTQSQLHFLPESHTDFIFATFAEQWGFWGCCLLLLLYYSLIRQGMQIALRTTESFGRLLGFGITMMLAIQILINIAMNLGFAPIVGIPLPLMSYGGSSIFITFIALGILVNIAKTRSTY